MQQLELWSEKKTEDQLILEEMVDLRQQQSNLRKGIFSRYEIMKKEIAELHQELALLRKLIKYPNTTEHFIDQFLDQKIS